MPRKKEPEEKCPKCGCPELLRYGRQTSTGLRVITSCPGCGVAVNEPEPAKPPPPAERRFDELIGELLIVAGEMGLKGVSVAFDDDRATVTIRRPAEKRNRAER